MTTFNPVLHSLLDTDLYKLTMMQAILHRHPAAEAEYAFQCRNQPEIPLSHLLDEINAQLDHLCSLSFTADELAYLRSLRYIKPDFVDFLEGFQLRRRFIHAEVSIHNPDVLEIKVQAPMVQGMLFEIFTLAIVSEVYFRQFNNDAVIAQGQQRLHAKVQVLEDFFAVTENQLQYPFQFFDFGTRRRFSREWQEYVVSTLATQLPVYFRGTSNVDLARRLGLVPIGTMAHEYLQAYQGFGVRLRDFQKQALEDWVQEYRGDLGIALTDVVGMDAFLRDFDLYFAKLFDGLRHDSGDPVVWGEKALMHYSKLGISAADKRLVFSDGLTMGSALSLYQHFANRIKLGFGIGTHLTNDLGLQPLNIVMKLVACNGQPVAKLSDSPGKTMCKDEAFLAYLRQVFNHYD